MSSKSIVNGRRLNFLNALDIAADGTVYFTDSSVYSRRDHILDVLDGRGTGRYPLEIKNILYLFVLDSESLSFLLIN